MTDKGRPQSSHDATTGEQLSFAEGLGQRQCIRC